MRADTFILIVIQFNIYYSTFMYCLIKAVADMLQ